MIIYKFITWQNYTFRILFKLPHNFHVVLKYFFVRLLHLLNNVCPLSAIVANFKFCVFYSFTNGLCHSHQKSSFALRQATILIDRTATLMRLSKCCRRLLVRSNRMRKARAIGCVKNLIFYYNIFPPQLKLSGKTYLLLQQQCPTCRKKNQKFKHSQSKICKQYLMLYAINTLRRQKPKNLKYYQQFFLALKIFKYQVEYYNANIS